MTAPTAAAPAVAALGLRKVYGELVAVDDISFSVAPGEAFGFLGPNGAGKTSTLKILLGLVRPTAGTARVLGLAPEDPRSRARVGFLPEHFRFPGWLRAAEFLEFHAALAGVKPDVARTRGRELLARVGLGERADTPIGKMSKGMQQRLGIAQALVSDPLVVFLDEPTSGLDPLGRRLVRELIRELKLRGVAVFLNSHLLGEVEAVCDRVAIVDRGKVVHLGTPGGLPGAGIEVEIAGEGISSALAPWFEGRYQSATFQPDGLRLRVPEGVDTREAVADAVSYLVSRGARIHRVTPLSATLEEVFVAVLGPSAEGE